MIDRLTIRHGHVLDQLALLPAESVQMVVTSPPYWGLRDYGLPPVKWPTGWDGAHGLEPTVELYVEHEVLIFREVRRVLRKDGILWLNLGDCYVAAPQGPDMSSCGLDGSRHNMAEKRKANSGQRIGQRSGFQDERAPRQDRPHKSAASFRRDRAEVGNIKHIAAGGLRPKNLIGLPWRVAFALQADGWYLRCDVVWHKPNPMPESVSDRPTKSHEFLFLFSKSEQYFYDAEAIKEPSSPDTHARRSLKASEFPAQSLRPGEARRRRPGVGPKAEATGNGRENGNSIKHNASFSAAVVDLVSSRNKRSVWTVPTAPYKEAHFATFPPDLIKPCILAGTSAFGACSECGAPFERVVQLGAADLEHQRKCGGDRNGEYHGEATKDYTKAKAQNASETKARILRGMRERKTVDWLPTCKCGDTSGRPAFRACVVLDPFGGSGTTGQVALELGRRAILIELNPEYVQLAERRCAVTPGLHLA